MTKEEAIKNIKEHCYFANLIPQAKEALDMAIKALEQEPCEDTVSRETLKEHLRARLYESAINNTDYTCVAAEVFEDIADNRLDIWLSELPSVASKPKTGHWIPTYGNVKCSVCGNVKSGRDVGRATHYCDFCGAKMESEE